MCLPSFSCPLLFGHTVLSLVVWTPFSIFINFSIYYPLFNIIGPACHCGRSRLSPSSTLPTPFSLHPTGPACHCGRSRLSPSSTFPTPFPLPPTGPACHCGRSRLFPFSLSYRPGLSLWQVPPIPSFDLLYISPSLPLL